VVGLQKVDQIADAKANHGGVGRTMSKFVGFDDCAADLAADFGDIGKKWRSFWGNFPNVCIVDYEQYQEKKRTHITRTRGEKHTDTRFGAALYLLSKSRTVDGKRITQEDMAAGLSKLGVSLTRERLSQLIKDIEAQAHEKNYSKL
jgi:hypothetical protein